MILLDHFIDLDHVARGSAQQHLHRAACAGRSVGFDDVDAMRDGAVVNIANIPAHMHQHDAAIGRPCIGKIKRRKTRGCPPPSTGQTWPHLWT